MKLLKHFSIYGKANSYLLGPEAGGNAVVIDPSIMDIHMLNMIENNNFYVRHIFLTHRHPSHFAGLKTLLKVYNARIYSFHHKVGSFPSTALRHGDVITLENGISIEVIHIEGHSEDSLVFKIRDMVFTGDVITAGLMGDASSNNTAHILVEHIKNRLLSLDGDCKVFPGHGPPSILSSEKKVFLLNAH